jgi:hypothetical protein
MLLRVGTFDGWPTLGWEVVDFIEAYCPHGPGDVQGSEFELDDEEVQLLLDLYRLYPHDHQRAGRRVVGRGMYSRAKGCRKSELAGAIVVAEARGPVRFDGWRQHGDVWVPVGRPVTAPFIRCLATEESQSGNTYGNVVAMLDHAAKHHPDVFGDVDLGQRVQGSTRVYLRADGGEIRPSTASSAAKDGGKESFAVEDEPHLYVTPELRAMDDTVRRNLQKRKLAEPWLFRTTTSHRPGQLSVAEDHFQHANAVHEDRAKPAGMYLNHREGPKPDDWEDDGQVMAMLDGAYDVKRAWMDLERILVEECRNPEAEQGDCERYFGNIAANSSEDAFDVKRWGDLENDELVIPKGELIVVGFDGARFFDSTGLIATHVETGFQWPLGIWERPFDAGDDWEIDEDDVDATVEQTFDEFDVWRMYGDPPYWESTLKKWQGRHGEKRVIPWYTNRLKAMAYAVRSYRNAQQAGDVTHNGDRRFTAHIGNSRRYETNVKDDKGKKMFVLRKEHPDSPNKIDAASAGTLSWEARGDAIAAGATKRKRHLVAGF